MAAVIHFQESIVVVKPGRSADRYGNEEQLDWTEQAVTTRTYGEVSVQPASSTEQDTGARNTVTSGWWVRSRAGVDLNVEPIDRIRWRGKECEVQGSVLRYPHPMRHGAVHHVEFQMDLRTG